MRACKALGGSSKVRGAWWTRPPPQGAAKGAKRPAAFSPERRLNCAGPRIAPWKPSSRNIEGLRFNTAIAAIYDLANKFGAAVQSQKFAERLRS